MKTAHEFRLRLKSYTTQQGGKSKGPKAQAHLPPTHATIVVARSYPSWQTFVINELKHLYQTNHKTLPDSKQLSLHFKDRPEIEKKYQKKLMSFVIHLKDLLEKSGNINAIDQHLSFDEYDVLVKNQDYFRRSLNVEQVEIRSTDSLEQEQNTSINIEDILPGEPIVHFRHESSVPIRFVNRQAFAPYFEWVLPVMNGDTVERLEARLRRNADRALRTAKTIRFYSFQHWELNSRTLPNMANPYQGLVELSNKQETFQIDTRHGTLVFAEKDIGNILVYFVE